MTVQEYVSATHFQASKLNRESKHGVTPSYAHSNAKPLQKGCKLETG
ncbi:hypothetical protein NIES3974_34840 [Calothrix sp. NIES-3974]|nr:hypothetical protein NIES3974_34840 [Calothrix sp. NIES-3974]